MLKNSNISKFYKWEYWPTSMFYVPNLPYAFYLAAKAKHSAFFSAANPCIKSSGNGTESKFKTIELVPDKYKPKSIFVNAESNFEAIIDKLTKKGITFPLIAKPDIGFRGLLVQKIQTKRELKTYLEKYPIAIIIQEFLDYKNECGIFYHKNPNEKEGKITSITLKRFLSVIGDGTSTLIELILLDNRAQLYVDILEEIHQEKLLQVPLKGEKIKLTAIGNHSKGTQFLCGAHLITRKLEKTFDSLSDSIPGWFYGRVDIKYNSFEELEEGKNFKILEINGILAEPTHIYDATNYNYFNALKAIRTHWKSIYLIATTNHNEHQVPYKSSRKFIEEMFELRAYTKKIKSFSKTN